MDEGEGEGEGEGESDKSESVSKSMHQAHGSADEDSGSDDYGGGDGAISAALRPWLSQAPLGPPAPSPETRWL